MSDLLKIKLTIANRVYPLSVAPEQEASLRASAKKIETKEIAKSLGDLPPIKLHCANMAAKALKLAIEDYEVKKKVRFQKP